MYVVLPYKLCEMTKPARWQSASIAITALGFILMLLASFSFSDNVHIIESGFYFGSMSGTIPTDSSNSISGEPISMAPHTFVSLSAIGTCMSTSIPDPNWLVDLDVDECAIMTFDSLNIGCQNTTAAANSRYKEICGLVNECKPRGEAVFAFQIIALLCISALFCIFVHSMYYGTNISSSGDTITKAFYGLLAMSFISCAIAYLAYLPCLSLFFKDMDDLFGSTQHDNSGGIPAGFKWRESYGFPLYGCVICHVCILFVFFTRNSAWLFSSADGNGIGNAYATQSGAGNTKLEVTLLTANGLSVTEI